MDADARIVERHACRDGVEVALIEEKGWFGVYLLTPTADGTLARHAIGGLHYDGDTLASRMMDMHTAICAAQWAGLALPVAPALAA